MKAIGYFCVRDSSLGEVVVVGQPQSFSEYCEKHGHQSVATFVDDETHGEQRPGYGDMVNYLKGSNSEFLVVIPGTQHVGDTLESSLSRVLELDSVGAKVICSDGDIPDPLQQALKYWNGVSVGRARGERIREAMKAKAIRGEGLGKPPFGYIIGSDSKLEVVPEESATVQLIFNLCTKENMGMRRIVRHLNERGIPTRGGRGWSIVTVRDVLRNRVYLGTYTRFGMRVPGNHQAIIDSDQFNLTQQKMTQGRTARVSHPTEPFLLAGFAYCAYCSNRMIGVTRYQGWNRKDGSHTVNQYRYYQCQSRTNQGMCSYHTWRSGKLEHIVMGYIKESLVSGALKLTSLGTASQHSTEFEKRSKRLKGQLMKILESTAAGITSIERLRIILQDIDSQINTPNGNVSSSDLIREAIVTGDLSYLLNDWESLDKNTNSNLVRALVSRVTVQDDSVEVFLNSGA